MQSSVIGETPLAGRQHELAALAARLEEACAGRGGVALIAGEPGIGKTRIAHAFAELARQRGALVLWGRGFEGGWSPPLAPWVEAIGAFVRAAEPALLRETLGLEASPGALAGDSRELAPLAEIIPDVAPLLAELPSLVALGPEEERFRLYDAVVRFLQRLAARQPVVVVLDDLHWADRPSLDLLRHLAHFIGQGSVLVVGIYRDLEIDAKHPLSHLVPTLRREAAATPITLKGLPVEAVGALLGGVAGANGRVELARTIHTETNGNPLFIEELIRHLSEEGALVHGDQGWTARVAVTSLGIPEGVRQVVARRLARLSPDTELMLTHAAVFTGGFDFAVLPALTGLPEEALLDAVDEALKARLIQPTGARPEHYDFVHAIIRHVLADGWSPSRRVRIHRRAAEALTRTYPGRAREHAAELAEQYHRSLSLPGAEAGIPHALAAAETARRAHGPEQAVGFLRMARDLVLTADAATATATGTATRAGILTRLAIAEAEAALGDDAQRTIEEALSALEQGGAAPSEVADFIASAVNGLKWRAAVDSRIWRPLIERGLALVRSSHDHAWARLMLLLDPIEPVARETIRVGRWLGFDREVVAILQATGDADDYARAVESWDPRSRADTGAHLARARAWTRPTAVMQALTVVANDHHYRHGAFRDAAALWQEIIELGQRHGAISWQAQAWNQLTWLHIAAGRFAEAREAEARANGLLARLGPWRKPDMLAMEMATSFAVYLGGDWPAIAAFWTRFVDDPAMGPNDVSTLAGALYGGIAAYAHAEAGNDIEARRLLSALTPILQAMDPEASNQNHNGAVAFAAGAVWRLGGADLAAAYRRLGLDLLDAGIGDYPQGSNALTVARMAALLGNNDEATRFFDQARRTLHAAEQDPLLAIVDLDEARASLRAGGAPPARTGELLDAALAAFEALEMPLWADRTRAARADWSTRAEAGAALPGGLTEREVDVLRLVARGYSDRQGSEELYISPRTVNAHVRNMLTKTNSANRTELSMWGFAQKLVTRGET